MTALGIKSGRKYVDRFSPVPEDDITPVNRSRSSSGSIFRRVRSFRDPSSSKEREKEKGSRRPESPDPSMLNPKRSQSAVSSKSSRSSSKGSGTKDKQRSGGLRSVSSSPNRSKARNTLGVDTYNMRPNSPMGKPLKSALKKGGSPTHMNRSTSPPARSKSSERKNSGNVFSRLYPYPGSGGTQDIDEGISDSRFHGVQDTLRIRKKKDPSKTAMVDFDGPVSHGGRHPQQSTQEEHDFLVSVHLQTYILVCTHAYHPLCVCRCIYNTHQVHTVYRPYVYTFVHTYVHIQNMYTYVYTYIHMYVYTYIHL